MDTVQAQLRAAREASLEAAREAAAVRAAHEDQLLALAASRGLRQRARLCLRLLHDAALRRSAARRLGLAAALRGAWRRVRTWHSDACARRDGALRAGAHVRAARDGAARSALGAALAAWRGAARRGDDAARRVARGGAWHALRAARRGLAAWAQVRVRVRVRLG